MYNDKKIVRNKLMFRYLISWCHFEGNTMLSKNALPEEFSKLYMEAYMQRMIH